MQIGAISRTKNNYIENNVNTAVGRTLEDGLTMRKVSKQYIFYSRNSLGKAVDFTSSQGGANFEI
jgi:hypothetical protein